MTLYVVAVGAHVSTAVLAVGLVGGIPLAARAGAERVVSVLLRITQLGFLTMLITGILLDVSVGGAFHHAGWFKASVVTLVLVGAAHAGARIALRKQKLALVERWGWAMCAGIAVITILMQTKPL